MKRIFLLMLSALFLAPIFALADDIFLDESAVTANMPCSYQQGYAPTVSGNTLTLHVPVRAEGMQRVTVTLHALNEAVSPLRTQDVTVTAYRSGSLYSATLQVQLRSGRVNGDYPMLLLLNGTKADGSAVSGEYPFTLHIRDGRSPGEVRPVISQVAAPLTVGESCALTAALTNENRYADVTNLTLKITDPKGDVLPAGTDTLLLGDIPAGETLDISVPLLVRPTADVSTHQLRFDLTWTAIGQSGTWTETFTLPVTAADEATRPFISDVAGDLPIGGDAVLTATLRNPGSVPLTGLTLKVSDPKGDILSRGTDTLLLPDIPADSSIRAEIPLSVRPTASISLHLLTISLAWEGGTWTETFTLPVTQEIRLEQGGAELPPSIIQGEMTTLTLPLMNMGRGELRNVLATLDLPGVANRQSVLVGAIAPGETKQARITFTPGKSVLGDFSGTVTVTAEDAYGNATSFALPVETAVEEAPVLRVNALEQAEPAGLPLWVAIALGAACGVLLIACIVQGAVLRGKIRHLEEARL